MKQEIIDLVTSFIPEDSEMVAEMAAPLEKTIIITHKLFNSMKAQKPNWSAEDLLTATTLLGMAMMPAMNRIIHNIMNDLIIDADEEINSPEDVYKKIMPSMLDAMCEKYQQIGLVNGKESEEFKIGLEELIRQSTSQMFNS